MQTTSHQYATGSTRERIERALLDAGKDPSNLAPADLAALEDFHTLGRLATAGLVELAAISAGDRVLDAGGGIGGTARFLADSIGCHVTSVDITAEYCDVARWLNGAVGLDTLIDVHHADVLDLRFDDASFEVVISQHVQMNIADKPRLYREIRRVLAPGGRLALWDVTAGPNQPIRFPVPWADRPELSHAVTPEDLHGLLTDAGFTTTAWNDLTEPAAQMRRTFLGAPPQPLGLHVFVPDFATKAANLLDNLEHDRVRLIQAVLHATDADV
jgi:sarcosine/dimethylglycine N-methyltransferase